MNISLIYTLIFCLVFQFSNDKNPRNSVSVWTAQELSIANTAAEADYLTQDEKDMFFYTNLVRINPVKFEATYLQDYLKAMPAISGSFSSSDWEYIHSLEAELKQNKSLPPLHPDVILSKTSKNHANNMGKNGLMGHVGSDNKNMLERIHAFGFKNCTIGENCQYGHSRGDYIICDLLVDYGIENLGHRRLLFSDKFDRMGVSIMPHSKYGYNAVMNFAGNCR